MLSESLAQVAETRLSKGRTIRKLIGVVGGGGRSGRSTKNIFAQRKIKCKKIHAHQLILKNIHDMASKIFIQGI